MQNLIKIELAWLSDVYSTNDGVVQVPELDGFNELFNHDFGLLTSQSRQLMLWNHLIAFNTRHAVVDFVHVHVLHLPNNVCIQGGPLNTIRRHSRWRDIESWSLSDMRMRSYIYK